MFTAITKIVAKSEASLQVKNSLKQVVEEAKCQKGSEKFVLYEATDDSNLYIIYQIWQSEEAFDAHLNSDFLKEWSFKVRPMIKTWRVYFLKKII